MAKQRLENGATFGEQRGKINDNFTELYDGKVDKDIDKSLVDNTEIQRLASVTNQDLSGLATEQFVTDGLTTKQPTLDSSNIKTVNGESLLGNGNIAVSGGGGFKGSISPTDTAPTVNGTYAPTISGTYTNAGGIVVNLADGYTTLILTGTTWTKQVVPIATIDAPFVIGKNKLNRNDVVSGGLIAGGAITPNVEFVTMNSIPVKPNTTYTYSVQDDNLYSSMGGRMAEYTSAGAIITLIALPNYLSKKYTFTTSANTYFLRSTHLVRYMDVMQLEEGAIVTRVEPWEKSVKKINGNIIKGADQYIYNADKVDEFFKPVFSIPSKMYATVGLEFNLYYDQIMITEEYGAGMPKPLLKIECAKGSTLERSFRFTPVVGDIGQHEIVFLVYNANGKIMYKSKHTITVVPKTALTGTPKKVVVMGDSNTATSYSDVHTGGSTVMYQLRSNLVALGGSTPLFKGSQSKNPVNNEGRSGFATQNYSGGVIGFRLNFSGLSSLYPLSTTADIFAEYKNAQNEVFNSYNGFVIESDGTGYMMAQGGGSEHTYPMVLTKTAGSADMPMTLTINSGDRINTTTTVSIFKNDKGNGVVDMTWYREKILRLAPTDYVDIFAMDLGLNDANNNNFDEIATIDLFLQSALTLYDAAVLDNPNVKFLFILPKLHGANAFTQIGSFYYKLKLFAIRNTILKEFDNNPLRPNAYVSSAGLGIDRWYGFKTGDRPLGARYPGQNFTAVTDSLHPNEFGYYQHADGISSMINYLARL